MPMTFKTQGAGTIKQIHATTRRISNYLRLPMEELRTNSIRPK